MHVVKETLSGHFCDLVVAMFQTPAEYDSNSLQKAMSAVRTDESVVDEIIISRSGEVGIKRLIARFCISI